MDEILMTLVRDLTLPVSESIFPKQYALVNVTELCRHLWESFMDACFGGYQAGAFRYIYVNNNFYEENRVYVLLNDKNEPIGTGNSWQTPDGFGYISYIGVLDAYRGRKIGSHITNFCLRDIKNRGFKSVVITTGEENLSAIKTYLNCGFIPSPSSEEDIERWEDIFASLNIRAPIYDKTVRVYDTIPHPPRPWPYQLAREKAAKKNGDVFIHGLWNRFNMYKADKTEYSKLKKLISDDQTALKRFHEINENGNVYIDSDINPQCILLENEGKDIRLYGVSKDGSFEDGLVLFNQEIMTIPN